MTASRGSWFAALLDALRRRLPIWQAVVTVAIAAGLLRLVPTVYWWGPVYAELRLDLWWPVVLLVVCGIFYRTGLRRHRRTGEPQFFPLSAGFAAIVCFGLLLTMLALSASHWGLLWCAAAAVCLAAAGRQLALAVVAYAELWRVCCHAQVEETVHRLLESGNLEETLRREAKRGYWGSPHGLCLLHGRLEADERQALTNVAQKGIQTALLERTVLAGDAYLTYFNARWAETVLPVAARDWERLDTSRELLTICLTATPEQADAHRARVMRWTETLKTASDPYFKFLVLCFVLGSCRAPDSRRAIEALPEARTLYAAAAVSGPKLPQGVRIDFRSVMQETWLAIAHRGIPAQAVFDLWMALRREFELPPLLARQSGPEWDAAGRAARKFLAAHYDDWAGRCAPGWGRGLSARRDWNTVE